MADQEIVKDVQLLKGTNVSVFVDEALQDLLVVTYDYGVKIFRGVLLDSNKKNIPCGIPNLNPAFSSIQKASKTNPDEDVLHSVNQRYAYMDPNYSKPKSVRFPSKYKNNKMTVRLRPRQVLCSKCKGICNENSENVSKKRKLQENVSTLISKRSADAPVTRSVFSEQSKKKIEQQKLQPTLIPKLSRLLPQEISNALNGKLENLNCKEDSKPKVVEEKAVINESEDIGITENKSTEPEVVQDKANTTELCTIPNIIENPDGTIKVIKRTLRKKRSVGSMEDLWDESVFEENVNLKNNDLISNNNTTCTTLTEQNASTNCANTRTIKISFGPQGEGTVLKIPAPIQKFNASDDSEENINIANCVAPGPKDNGNKAARKALKRAKKRARQKVVLSGNSPSYIHAMSPRYSIGGGTSPRYSMVGASPRHSIGNNSPRYVNTIELNLPRRHKHKLKRKRRHRDIKDKKHKDDEVALGQENIGKEQAIAQKLSISLKRRHNTYTSCQNKSEEITSSSDEQSESAPDFPPSNAPLVLHANTQTVPSAQGMDGDKLKVGDVVWGKLQGFPWWPGKITTITTCGSQPPQAYVTWYGSTTSSLLQCDQISAFLSTFKFRYNKKKRGAYKEAIRQATNEANENAESEILKDTTIRTVPAPALASPREIDVMS